MKMLGITPKSLHPEAYYPLSPVTTLPAHSSHENTNESNEHLKMNKSTTIELLRGIVAGIGDNSKVLITAKPKNKSKRVRRSNRHSNFRGVSLNGKKWQVMIMGTKKNYFGCVESEVEAAKLYDELSIVSHGLAAKTNFNYTKGDLELILQKAEYLDRLII